MGWRRLSLGEGGERMRWRRLSGPRRFDRLADLSKSLDIRRAWKPNTEFTATSTMQVYPVDQRRN